MLVAVGVVDVVVRVVVVAAGDGLARDAVAFVREIAMNWPGII